MEIKEQEEISTEERPPFFRRWRSWYLLVLIVLGLLILFFYLFTHNYA